MENLKNVAPIEDFNWDAYENGEAFSSSSWLALVTASPFS